MNFEDAVGKMCLIIKSRRWVGDVEQVRILKISPNGKYVRYRLLDDTCKWERIIDIDLLDILDG